jgi:hypothetical protein
MGFSGDSAKAAVAATVSAQAQLGDAMLCLICGCFCGWRLLGCSHQGGDLQAAVEWLVLHESSDSPQLPPPSQPDRVHSTAKRHAATVLKYPCLSDVPLRCTADGVTQPCLYRRVSAAPQPSRYGYDFSLEERIVRDAKHEADARDARVAAAAAQAEASAREAAEAAALMEAAEEAQLQLDDASSTGSPSLAEPSPQLEEEVETPTAPDVAIEPEPELVEPEPEPEPEPEVAGA